MTSYAFDGASPFDLAAAKANGAAVITGYVIGRPGGQNPIDKARVDEILALGLGFLPNAELAANFFDTCTLAEAKAMGAEAATACTNLGLPADGSVAIPGSFDFDFGADRYPEMWQKLAAYGRGLTGYLPRAYGPQGFLDYITAPSRMPGTKHWLMMSTFGQPYNPASPSVCMAQEHTLTGAWLSSPVAATDVSTITDLPAVHAYFGGTDMTPAQEAKLDKALALLAALPADVWAANLQSVDATGKPDSGIHPAKLWITDAAQSVLAVATPARDAAANAAIRIAALQARVDKLSADLTAQVAGVGTAVTAIPTEHPTIDLAAVTTAAQAGTKAALTGATIAATITPGA